MATAKVRQPVNPNNRSFNARLQQQRTQPVTGQPVAMGGLGGFLNAVAGGSGGTGAAGVGRPPAAAPAPRPSPAPAPKPAPRPQPMAQPTGQQPMNQNAMQFALMAANQGNWNLANQILAGQRPQQAPEPTYNSAVGPNLMGAAQQAGALQRGAQNYAMADAVGGVNNYGRVSGPLTGVYSMPVAPGSVHGAANSPSQAAMLGQYVARQANLHYNKDYTLGGQQALSDYVTDPVTGQRRLGDPNNPADQALMLSRGGQGGGGGNGGGSGGANTGNSTLDNFLNQMQGARDQANAANEARYQEALGIRRGQQQMAEADINRAGQARAQEIRDNARRADADVVQNLTARGLANTTSVPVLRQGVQREAAKQQTQLGDLLSRQRLDANQMLNTNVVDLIREKQDVGPNWDTMANLAMAAAQANSPTPQFPLGQLLSMLGGVPGIGQMPMGGGQQQQMMPQQQWRPFQMNGQPNVGNAGNAGGQGGLGQGLGNVGASLGQFLSQLPGLLASGAGGMASGSGTLSNIGNAIGGLGGGIAGAASSLSNWLGSLGIPQGGVGNTLADWRRANLLGPNINYLGYSPGEEYAPTQAAQEMMLAPYFFIP